MLYPILATFFSAASYVLTKYFVSNGYIQGVKIVTIMFHTNIINLSIFFTYYFYKKFTSNPLFDFREKFINVGCLWQLFLLGLPVLSAIVKSEITEFIPISTIEVSSMIKPFMVSFLAIFLLKEKFHIKYIFCFIIALIGFYIINMKKMSLDSNAVNAFFDHNTIWLVFYIIVSALGNVTRRYYCRKRTNTMEAICAEYLVFFIYGTSVLIASNTFSISLLFNKYVLCVSSLTLMHHYCMIHGVQKAKSVAALELLNFSKTIFTLLLSWLLLADVITGQKVIGALIIAFSMVLNTLL